MNDKSFLFISEGKYRMFAGESEEELVIFWCNFEVFCMLLLTDSSFLVLHSEWMAHANGLCESGGLCCVRRFWL